MPSWLSDYRGVKSDKRSRARDRAPLNTHELIAARRKADSSADSPAWLRRALADRLALHRADATMRACASSG
jgi:hypothetical protein